MSRSFSVDSIYNAARGPWRHTAILIPCIAAKRAITDSAARSTLNAEFWMAVALYAVTLFWPYLAAYVSNLNRPRHWSLVADAQVALVTGGLSGLGLEITRRLLQETAVAKVIIIDIQPPKIELPDVQYHKCDVGNHDELKALLSRILSDLDSANLRILVLVNNAGVRNSGALLQLEERDIFLTFNVNVIAQILTLREVLSHHKAHHSGSELFLVTVLSVLGIFGPKNLLLYSGSKAAALQIHECLTEEVRSDPRIQTLLVVPGQLNTEMFGDVSPSRQFFAPVVDYHQLAQQIVRRAVSGNGGILCEPLYASLLPAVKLLPLALQRVCRWFSQMDEKIPDRPQ